MQGGTAVSPLNPPAYDSTPELFGLG
jgi:hypothetical protein